MQGCSCDWWSCSFKLKSMHILKHVKDNVALLFAGQLAVASFLFKRLIEVVLGAYKSRGNCHLTEGSAFLPYCII